jgi:hypothetical protein
VLLPILRFLAVLLTALVLVPAGAHLFELPNKIDLHENDYFIVQNIYRGWALFGIVLFGALGANLALAFAAWRQGRNFIAPLIAFACIGVGLIGFFTWTYPANVATSNWTEVPANWQVLRQQWEYSHAANALLNFVGFCALAWSVARGTC